jgi:ComF family protein
MAGPSIASESEISWACRFTRQAAEGLFAVLFPSDCRICGDPLAKISRLPVCQECLDAMRPMNGGLCSICGERVPSSFAVAGNGEESEIRCGLCQRIEPPFARAMAYGSYDGALRELIHLLKYESMRPAANVLGRMLAEVIAELQPGFGSDPVLVIPVPLYRAKLRHREFNHAELIARMALKLNPKRGRLLLNPGLLVRKRETVSQTGLTRHQRRENVRGAFGVTDADAVKAREVLMVDDVFTTGATVAECARVLRRAGASKVWVATVARTLKIVEQHVEIRLPEAEVYDEAKVKAAPEVLARAAGL